MASILAANPETTIRSLSCRVSPDHRWRVGYVSGGGIALEELVETVGNAEYYTGCLARWDCEADWVPVVLDRTEGALVLDSYWTRTPFRRVAWRVVSDAVSASISESTGGP